MRKASIANILGAAGLVAFLLTAQPLFAQTSSHVFPQFVDGRFSDGSYYRSTLMIIPAFEGDAPTCTLTLNGLTATFEGGSSTGTVAFNIAAGSFAVLQTTGQQPFQGGYAALSCSHNIFANVLYAFHAPNGGKVGEATVFAPAESFKFRMIADHRESARFGMAIANNTDAQQTYVITYVGSGVNRTTTITVPARRSLARFLDEITSIPAGSVGVVTITSQNLASFSVIGLRFTGGIFTTIPAN